MFSLSIATDQENSPTAEVLSVSAEATVPEAECAILLAAGLQTSTPNNEYIQQKYGSLSIDLTFDAQDIYLDEVKFDKTMFENDSKLSEYDVIEETPRKLRRKRKSKLGIGTKGGSQSDASKSNGTATKGNGIKTTVQPPKEMKRKRIRKRKSTKLEDELSLSDDSLDLDVKEEIQFLQKNGADNTAVVETVATEKILKKKKSSKLDEELTPSEDSLDEREKEWKEFKQDVKGVVNEIEEQNIAVEEINAKQTSDGNIDHKNSARKDGGIAKDKKNRQEQSNDKGDKDLNSNLETKYKDINQINTRNNQNSEDRVKSETMKAEKDQTSQTKETKTERLERLSIAKADMYPDDSPDSESLTPVEVDVTKRRKRKKQNQLNKGSESVIKEVMPSNVDGTESKEKEKRV